MKFRKLVLGAPGTLLFLSILGCGGGNGDFVAYVGGNLSGLADGKAVVLRNNAGSRDEDITLTQNGSFKFGRRLVIYEDYDVVVRIQPAGQQCVVTRGSGSIKSSSDDITDVSVNCR
jgi:hypothetical protein